MILLWKLEKNHGLWVDVNKGALLHLSNNANKGALLHLSNNANKGALLPMIIDFYLIHLFRFYHYK